MLAVLLSGCALLDRLRVPVEDSPPPDLAPALEIPSQPIGPEARASLSLPSSRVRPLPSPPLQLTREVKRELANLMRGDAHCIRVSHERRAPHYETIRQIFIDEGIPLDLMNLAVIESRFDLNARSRSGAVGMWQFTRATAKVYGLKVDGKLDQRKDPILSTLAATRMLRDLYTMFGDWYFALAGYNAGPWALRRAIAKYKADDFWALARAGGLSRQTREFVPRYIAATILMKTADKHGFDRLRETVEEQLGRVGASLHGPETALKSEGIKFLEAEESHVSLG